MVPSRNASLKSARWESIRLYEEDDLYAEVNQDLIDQAAALITRGYHFSSAHRVSADRVGEAENQRLFGNCHSPPSRPQLRSLGDGRWSDRSGKRDGDRHHRVGSSGAKSCIGAF